MEEIRICRYAPQIGSFLQVCGWKLRNMWNHNPARHTAIFWTFAPVLYKGHRIFEWSWRNTVSSGLLEEEYWQIWSVVASTPVCAARNTFFHVDLEFHFTRVRLFRICYRKSSPLNVPWQGRLGLWCHFSVGLNVFLVASLTNVGKNNSC